VPLTLEAGVLFSVLVAPGFLLSRGYTRRRTHLEPERDLYALGQAIVGSLFLLATVWVGLSVFDQANLLRDLREGHLDGHETVVFWMLVGLLLLPYLLGGTAAALTDLVGNRPTRFPGRHLRWTGLFDVPTSWDAIWLRVKQHPWALVSIEFRDGTNVFGVWAKGSQVDLSPKQDRHVFLSEEYRYVDGAPQKVEGDGIWIRSDEVAFVRIRAFKAKGAGEGEGVNAS
jgi:Family of unknown function (DUF6338)